MGRFEAHFLAQGRVDAILLEYSIRVTLRAVDAFMSVSYSIGFVGISPLNIRHTVPPFSSIR